MREKDIHKLIEQQEPETKQRIWERINAELNLDSEPYCKPAPKKKVGRWVALAVALVCVVTLSIVLPLVLNKDDGIRFATANDYTVGELGQTVKEYSDSRKLNLLYVDWYAIADGEARTDYAYANEDKNDVIFLKENIINGETGDEILLCVTDNKTRVDILEDFYKNNENYTVKDVNVSWHDFNEKQLYAMFEYNNYIYYLQLNSADRELLTSIIQDMLK